MRVSGIVEASDMDKGGSSSVRGTSSDTFEALQFVRKIYADDAAAGGSSSKSSTTPAAGKKAKCAASGFRQSPPPTTKCQVEGCDLDLKGAKSYYCRHRVCGMHSKSPKVIVAGLEQRFCQQCSRFHLLKEFDQGKRSCRRRLAGHNERRRKPPPSELLPSRYDRLSSFPGSTSIAALIIFLRFLNTDFSLPDDNGGLHRGYLMDFMHPKPPESEKESILWPSLRSGNLFSASELALGACIVGVSDSTRALSLLSNQPWGASSAFMSPTNTNQQPPVIRTSVDVESSPPNTVSCYLNSLPGFNDHELGISLSHEAGLRQIDDTVDANDQFSSSDVGPIEVYDHLHDLQWLL